ncbi:MAG: MoxR family ATPase [Lachnospiraceae bacterium]|nr:MoxR family ATPase [Lachnospiraceae bacterium]
MNIQEAREEIIRTVRAYTAKKEDGSFAVPSLRQRPLLLIGPPGIGKTAVMEQAARECQVGFISYTMTHHTRQSAMGLPYIERRMFGGKEYAVTEYTMSEIIASVYRCMEETGVSCGLLFLDEINCVSETLAPAILQFLQNKTFGSHRLPDGWVLAAAGNPPEYNKSVHEFDIATLDRLKYIPVEADYNAWRSYALSEAVHGAILAYLDTHPGQFYILRQTYASRSFATARGWEDLSCMLKEYELLDFPVDARLVSQYLQDTGLAKEFALFYQLYRSKGQQFPVALMLSGDQQAMEACRILFSESPFEEQLYFVHLILSCIDGKLNEWRNARRQKERFTDAADRLTRFQKQYRKSHPQQSTPSPLPFLDAFLEKERGILQIRREHGLSSDSELEEMRQALLAVQETGYELYAQTSAADASPAALTEACTKETQKMENLCVEKAEEILNMLEYGIRAIAPEKSNPKSVEEIPGTQTSARPVAAPDNPESDAALVLFLSSLRQNPVAESIFKQYPDNPCASYWKKLDFSARENAIKELLAL